ncbi:hypothetical protein D3C75_1269910 [compost metagenome]
MGQFAGSKSGIKLVVIRSGWHPGDIQLGVGQLLQLQLNGIVVVGRFIGHLSHNLDLGGLLFLSRR